LRFNSRSLRIIVEEVGVSPPVAMETIQRMTARSILNFRSKSGRRSSSRGNSSASSTSSSPSAKSANGKPAPHPIPAGSEGRVCPISGLFADAVDLGSTSDESRARLAELQADPDIAEEIRALAESPVHQQVEIKIRVPARPPAQFVRFNVVGSHSANASTRQLVQSVGLPALVRFTKAFYQKSFADSHVDQFIASHDEPHHERFALWIVEKFGDGTPWTEERRTRPAKYMHFGGGETRQVAHDRSSAHFAAWHSPKREPHVWGNHFVPEDARVWMRLHFWAARETGMFEHEAFMEYYTRFIGHFISVYSSKSPPFTRESARWSADPQNIQRYLDAGRRMTDVIGQDTDQALEQLPADERIYTGSRASNPAWPYEQ
jgi:hypothetical protein